MHGQCIKQIDEMQLFEQIMPSVQKLWPSVRWSSIRTLLIQSWSTKKGTAQRGKAMPELVKLYKALLLIDAHVRVLDEQSRIIKRYTIHEVEVLACANAMLADKQFIITQATTTEKFLDAFFTNTCAHIKCDSISSVEDVKKKRMACQISVRVFETALKKKAHQQAIEAIEMQFIQASGSVWKALGTTKPDGQALVGKHELESHLRGNQMEFTDIEWQKFKIDDLRMDHFVTTGTEYFSPRYPASMSAQTRTMLKERKETLARKVEMCDHDMELLGKGHALPGMHVNDPKFDLDMLKHLNERIRTNTLSTPFVNMSMATTALGNSIRKQLTRSPESTQLVVSESEKHAMVSIQAAQEAWKTTAAAQRDDALSQRDVAEAELDKLIHLDHVPKRYVETAAPIEGGYKRKAPTKKEVAFSASPRIRVLQAKIRQLDAILIVSGHRPTINKSAYKDCFDTRFAVASHPQMRVATRRAEDAQSVFAKLKKDRTCATTSLCNREQQIMSHMERHGTRCEPLLPVRTEEDDFARIQSAVGPYDLLQLERDCNPADVRHASVVRYMSLSKRVQLPGCDQNELNISKMINAAATELTNGTNSYAINHPIQNTHTKLQRKKIEMDNKREDTLMCLHRRLLEEFFLLLTIPPLGLSTTWKLGSVLNKHILMSPVLDLLRHPNIKVEGVTLASNKRLYTVVEELVAKESDTAPTGMPLFVIATEPPRVGVVTFSLPGGFRFDTPLEVVLVRSSKCVFEFPDIVAAVESKCREPMNNLLFEVEVLILRRVCFFVKERKGQLPITDAESHVNLMSKFGIEVRRRLPPFLSGWLSWSNDVLLSIDTPSAQTTDMDVEMPSCGDALRTLL